MNIILTPREKEIFNLLIKNQSTRDIAKTLGISEIEKMAFIFNCNTLFYDCFYFNKPQV